MAYKFERNSVLDVVTLDIHMCGSVYLVSSHSIAEFQTHVIH